MDEERKVEESASWFALLPETLSLITEDECLDPGHEVEEREEVVGAMNLEEKRLHTLMMRIGKEKYDVEGNIAFLTGGNLDERKRELVKQGASLESKGKIIRAIMFNSIQDRLKLWDKSVGIREGFQVVQWEEKGGDGPDPKEFLRRLFGGGGGL